MSLFSVGGNLGYALGPILATPLVLWQGLKGGLFLMVPCLVIALILLRARPFLQGFATEAVTRARRTGHDDVRSLVLLLGVICFRIVRRVAMAGPDHSAPPADAADADLMSMV